MAQISRQVGTTSQVVLLFIQDSSSTTGAGLTGLAYNTASLACYYKRSRGTASVSITLADITTLGTFVSGGFKEVDATNLPGVYEFHPPDAALASGADSVAFLLKGATNMSPCPLIIELTGTSNQDATAGGISRLDAAVTSRMATYTQPTGFLTATFPTTVASTTNITAGTITTATNVTTVNGFAAGSITAASIAVSALDGKGNWNVGKTGYSLTATTGLGNQTANITGNLSGSVGSVTGLTNDTIADQVWDEILSGHAGVGSAGAALSAAGGSGDPWSTALPGAYGAGTAGYILGTNLDAAISSRSTYAGADTAGTTTLLSRVTAAVALAGSAPSWYATTGLKLASDGLDSVVIETGVNARQAVSAILASAAGVLSGADTGTVVIKGGNVATTRITATTDADGNRSAITLNLPS